MRLYAPVATFVMDHHHTCTHSLGVCIHASMCAHLNDLLRSMFRAPVNASDAFLFPWPGPSPSTGVADRSVRLWLRDAKPGPRRGPGRKEGRKERERKSLYTLQSTIIVPVSVGYVRVFTVFDSPGEQITSR